MLIRHFNLKPKYILVSDIEYLRHLQTFIRRFSWNLVSASCPIFTILKFTWWTAISPACEPMSEIVIAQFARSKILCCRWTFLFRPHRTNSEVVSQGQEDQNPHLNFSFIFIILPLGLTTLIMINLLTDPAAVTVSPVRKLENRCSMFTYISSGGKKNVP